jgi:hypothetical protein
MTFKFLKQLLIDILTAAANSMQAKVAGLFYNLKVHIFNLSLQ